MKTYKNVGLYKLCRIFPENATRFPVEEANETIRTDAPLSFLTEDDISDFEEKWKKQTVYYDLVEYGQECERENLTRLIEDAKNGKIDHICIYSLWDFWHNPNKLVETINELKSLPTPVGIRFYHCSSPCVFNKSSLDEKECKIIIQEIEVVEKIALNFKSVQANKSFISKGLTRAVINEHLDSVMLVEFLTDFYILPFSPSWQEIQKELGTNEADSKALKDVWSPSKDGLNKIIRWGAQDILQYYLA